MLTFLLVHHVIPRSVVGPVSHLFNLKRHLNDEICDQLVEPAKIKLLRVDERIRTFEE